MVAHALIARQASTRQAQETPYARIVERESTLQPSVQHRTHAATVLETPTHLRAAGLWRAASATQARLDRMGARAISACQASTRRPREPPYAHPVERESILLQQAHLWTPRARTVMQASTLYQEPPNARHAVLATTKDLQDKTIATPHVPWGNILYQQPVHARIATRGTTKDLQDKTIATPHVPWGNILYPQPVNARIAALATTKPLPARAHAPHASLASIRRSQVKRSARAARRGFTLA